MTPQDLMDLPYAGMAEKQLRKDGRWRLTPREKLEYRIGRLEGALGRLEETLEDAQGYALDIEHEMEKINEIHN